MSNNLVRPLSLERSYRRLYILVTEGAKSERNYFENIKKLLREQDRELIVTIETMPTQDGCSAPNHLIDRAEKKEKETTDFNKDKDGDQIWIIHDRDKWTVDHLNSLDIWKRTNCYRHLAISVPDFEYWVLLHFEDGTGLNDKPIIAVKKYLPYYKKDYNFKFTFDQVEIACKNAEIRHINKDHEHSTLYLLIDNLFKS